MKCLSRIALFVTMLICNNCSNDNEKIVKKTFDDGSYLIVPYTIKNGDTVLSGIGKRYSSNHKLVDQFEYRNSRLNGWHYHFKLGKLISKVWLVNDSANGSGFFFNTEGKIERENFYYYDRLIASNFFYPNGRIRLINFYDNDLAFYAIKYDSLGKKIGEKGVVFAHNFITTQNLDSMEINDTLELRIPIVSVSEYDTRIEVAKFDHTEQVYDVAHSVPIDGYFAIYRTSFQKPGLQMLGIAGELIDSNGIIIKRDTIYRRIKVIK